MINIYIVLAILFIHWFADFVCQSDWQAQNKSKNNSALLEHTSIYSVIWYFPMIVVFLFPSLSLEKAIVNSMAFVSITFVCHTIQDYFTSRLNSKLWEQKKVHNFFVSVGLDQFGHYVQLLLTYYLLA